MKKRYLILCIVVWILVFAIIPVDLYLISMSDIVIVSAIAAAIAAGVLFVIRSHAHKGGKIAISVISILVAAAFLMVGYVCNPYWNSTFLHSDSVPYSLSYDAVLTTDEAMEDLEYSVRYLKKLHPASYGGLPSDVEARYEEVKAYIGSKDSITVNELSREIESIFSLIHDGHTLVCLNSADNRYLKYVYGWDGDGYSISAVNGITISDLLDQKSDLYSFECISSEINDITNDIISVAGLDYLGFNISSGITYTISSDNGDTMEVVCRNEDYLTIEDYNAYNGITDEGTAGDEPCAEYEIDEERSLVVLNIYECVLDDEYKKTVSDMFTEVKQKDIRNVAVDVRYNPGGSDAVVTWFFRYLDIDEYRICTCDRRLGPFMIDTGDGIVKNDRIEDLTFTGNLYVLTTSHTFSAAMEFAQFIRDNDLGIIIGEAPSNDPNSYGDVAFFSLPNSGLFMQISTKNWRRADPDAPEGLIEPDIVCDIDHYDDSRQALYEAISEER